VSKIQDRLRVRASATAMGACLPESTLDGLAADLLDECERALRELADTIPTDARAYAIGPRAAAAHKQAREVLAKLEGAK
jgi:hypothetical protein